MSADEFFNKYSIEEINRKTKISPISLRFIKNKEFDKLPRVKFIGFVRLIEKKFKVDLSDLVEEYENYIRENKSKNKLEEISEKKEDNINYYFILILVLFILSVILYFKFIVNKSKKTQIELKSEKFDKNFSDVIIEKNTTDLDSNSKKNIIDKNVSIVVKKNENNLSLIPKDNNLTKEFNITIIPNEIVWFKAINIDNNKTKEYLTSHIKTLKGNYYIKFGHGNITIRYNGENIVPNTKKIVRILFKNGTYEFLKKPNKYEK